MRKSTKLLICGVLIASMLVPGAGAAFTDQGSIQNQEAVDN